MCRQLGAVIAFFTAFVVPAFATDDVALTRMAICEDSWVDWSKGAPEKLKTFGDHFSKLFNPHGNDPYVVAKLPVTIAGLHVVQAYPNSVGMGVGFSVLVEASFDKARTAIEAAAHRSLKSCETSDGMRACEIEVGPQRTITLMSADDPKSNQTLVGCYYFYEK